MKLEELTGLTAEQKIKALIIYDVYCYKSSTHNNIDIKSTEELEDLRMMEAYMDEKDIKYEPQLKKLSDALKMQCVNENPNKFA